MFFFVAGDLLVLPLTIRTATAPVLRKPVNRQRRHVASPTSVDPRDHFRRRPDYPAAAVARQRGRNRARRTTTITRITTILAVWSTMESILSTSLATRNRQKSRGIKATSYRITRRIF